jgi:hypothetical protein
MNINRECVYANVFGVLSKGADVFVIQTGQLPAVETPIDNYSLGRKSLDGSLEIEPKWLCQSLKQTKNLLNVWLGDSRAGLNSFNKKQLSCAGRESNYDSSVVYIIA